MTRPLRPHPKGWPVVTLEPSPDAGFVLLAASGSTPDTGAAECWGGSIPWLTPKEVASRPSFRYVVGSERTISLPGLKQAGRLWEPGSVMLTKRAPVGVPVINRVAMATNQGFLNFTCGVKLMPEYLYWWLLANTPYLEAVANGSTYPELYVGDLFELEMPVPTLLAQQGIAYALGIIDDKIELNRRLSKTLEAMARMLFRSWFVDFDPVRAKAEGRDAGLPQVLADLFPNSFEDSDLGEIPRGWNVRPLRDLTSYFSRGIGPAYIKSGGICVLNQKCLRDQRIDFSIARRHNQAKRPTGERLLHRLDVLVNSTGVGTLGRAAQVWHLPEPSIVDSHMTVLRAAPDVDPWFFGVGLTGREAELEALGEGSTGQTELSRGRLGDLLCLVPPNEVQKQFGLAASQLLERLSSAQRESATLAALRDTLLPKLISGELRVKNLERLVAEVA